MYSPSGSKQAEKTARDTIIVDPRIDREDLTGTFERIGAGNFGQVRKAHYKFVGDVAVKFPKENEHVIKECEYMKKYFHPNCVSVYGIVDHRRYGMGYVMELMTGGSLHSALENNRKWIKVCHAVEWMRQITSAVAFLHKHDVIHRDIKPHNLLLSADYSIVKICDFGNTRTVDVAMTIGQGTPLYIAPECLQTKDYNSKSDVYSCAITFWQLLSHRIPYDHLRGKGLLVFLLITDPGLRPEKIDCDPKLWAIIENGWDADWNLRIDAASMFQMFTEVTKAYPWESFPCETFGSLPGLSATASSGYYYTGNAPVQGYAPNDETLFATCINFAEERAENGGTLQDLSGSGDSGIDTHTKFSEYFQKTIPSNNPSCHAVQETISRAFHADLYKLGKNSGQSSSNERLSLDNLLGASGQPGHTYVSGRNSKIISLLEHLVEYCSAMELQVQADNNATIVPAHETHRDILERMVDCLHNILLLETSLVHQKEVKQTTSVKRLEHVLQLVKHAFITGRQPTTKLLDKIHMELQILGRAEVETSPQLEDACLRILEFEDAVTVENPEDEEHLHY